MRSILKSKSTKIVITILLSIFTLFLLSTIAYSSFSSTMNITGIAHSRVEADVRITNFTIDELVNATSKYEEFSKNTVSSSITFEEDAYAIYKVEVTNYGETEVGVYSIEGFPEGATYELIDYNLKDKICNINEKYTNYATKVFYIKIRAINVEESITLTFDFRIFHKISYTNFTNNYINEVLDGDSIEIDLTNEAKKFVTVDGISEKNYSYNDYILVINNVSDDIEIKAINDINKYEYTGNYQTFIVPVSGKYKVELWGAGGGGTSSYPGGNGGYTSGTIYLTKNTKLYVYVGQSGMNTSAVFNNGNTTRTDQGAYSGGGSTDIRLVSGEWSNFESLKSRIMVASSGGGATTYYSANSGGAGGGLTGYSGAKNSGTDGNAPSGGSQTSGGTNGGGANISGATKAEFGTPAKQGGQLGTGGNGYYAGGNGPHGAGTVGTGAGGSSFISGHDGCNAIDASSTQSNIIHTGLEFHYSEYIFTDTIMIDGKGYSWTTEKASTVTKMPTQDGAGTMTGNTGNGYAKITLIEQEIKKYPIKYVGIEGDHPKEGITREKLIINFKEYGSEDIIIYIGEKRIFDFTYQDNILMIDNNTGENMYIIDKKYEYNFSYTGAAAEFTAPKNGIYRIELWGAGGGGDGGGHGGYGAYTKGDIEIQENIKIYVYVGQQGYWMGSTSSNTIFNGGGYSRGSGSGGGATDIRLTSGNWNNTSSLRSRIMVAGGGGGSDDSTSAPGGAAGGLQSYSNYDGKTATQTSGYSFGTGGSVSADTGAGGGGYYGGQAGSTVDSDGVGGTSFISGHAGCNAINESGSHTGTSNHYSGYTFINTRMIDGKGYFWDKKKRTLIKMPTHDGLSTMIGNNDSGYAKITLLELT